MIGTADPIIEKMRAYNGAVDPGRLARAFEFGKVAHDGQTRASGEPYFTHPVAVANILADMRLDEDSISPHCSTTLSRIAMSRLKRCRPNSAVMSRSLSTASPAEPVAIKSLPSSAQAENFRKLLMAMSEDVRVLLVKLADRTHNMRTLSLFRSRKSVSASLARRWISMRHLPSVLG